MEQCNRRYVIGGSYRPITGLSFSPKYELKQAFSDASRNRRDTRSASLGVKYSYAPWALDLALNGSLATSKTSDGTEDNRTTKTSLSFTKDLAEALNLPRGELTLTLTLNSSQHQNFLSPDLNAVETSGFLLLKIAR